MKKLIVLFILICSAYLSKAQTSFYKQFSSDGYDYGQGIIELPDSSYIITGASSSFTEGPSQMFLLKIDSLGNYIWSKSYGGTEIDWGRRVKHIPNDCFFVGGFTNSQGYGAYDFALWKMDESGNEQWFKTYGTDGWERVYDMAITTDNGVILVGETNKSADGLTDIYIVRTDYSGNKMWEKQFANLGDDNALTISQLDDSTFIIGGYFYNNTSNNQEAWLCRIQDEGTVLWTNNISDNTSNFDIADLDIYNKEIYSVGSSTSGANDSHLFVLKSDALTGNIIDNAVVPNNYFSGKGITRHANDDLFSICASYFEEGVAYGLDDLKFYGYTSNPYYYTTLGAVQYETQQVLGDMSTTYTKGSIAVGYNENIGPGGSSVFVIRIGGWQPYFDSSDDFTTSPLVSLNSLESSKSDVAIYPNPSQDKVTIIAGEQTENKEYIIQLVDGLGRTVYSVSTTQLNQQIIDVSNLTSGIYTLIIVNQNEKFIKRLEVR